MAELLWSPQRSSLRLVPALTSASSRATEKYRRPRKQPEPSSFAAGQARSREENPAATPQSRGQG